MTTASPLKRQLAAAKANRNDEFYTTIETIEAELVHYRTQFAGKTVYLNCDDPRESQFYRYFAQRFVELGLKRLIATGYVAGGRGVYVDHDEPPTGDVPVKHLDGDGDFRSPECVTLLEQADVVVTNPPFSLFREHIAQVIAHDKSFLIVGTTNFVSYKGFIPLLHAGKVWPGANFNKALWFVLPEHYERWERRDDQGRKMGVVPSICWYTNMEHGHRRTDLELTATYDPDTYPVYDTYDAIDVSRVADIPVDYAGKMGVPITFLGKWNPDQFEILGRLASAKPEGTNFGAPIVNGKHRYARLVIRRLRRSDSADTWSRPRTP